MKDLEKTVSHLHINAPCSQSVWNLRSSGIDFNTDMFSLTIFIATVLVTLSLTQLCRNVGSKDLGYVPSDVGGSCYNMQLVPQAMLEVNVDRI